MSVQVAIKPYSPDRRGAEPNQVQKRASLPRLRAGTNEWVLATRGRFEHQKIILVRHVVATPFASRLILNTEYSVFRD